MMERVPCPECGREVVRPVGASSLCAASSGHQIPATPGEKPACILLVPDNFSQEAAERIKSDWERRYTGTEAA